MVVERCQPRPSYLFWETHVDCNLNCIHCGSECRRGKSREVLQPKEVVRAFRTIADAYDPQTINVAVTGGEPLMYDGLFDAVSGLHQLGFRWGMVSNGTMIDSEACRAMRRNRMHSISISLQGPEAIHERFSGQRGCFAKTVRSLELLLAHGFDIVEVITTVCPDNLGALRETERLLLSLGVSHWRLINVFPIGRGKQQDMLLTPQQYQELFQFIATRRRPGYPIHVTFGEDGHLPPEYRNVRDPKLSCTAGTSTAAILHNGDVIGCPSNDRGFVQGNVRQRAFVDLWENEFDVYRDHSWKRRGACADCREFGECQGGPFHVRTPRAEGPAFCVNCHMQTVEG